MLKKVCVHFLISVEGFMKSQDFRVLIARIRILCNHGFFDYALTLCSVIVNRLNSCDEYRKSMPPEAALSFRDIFYVLLAKQGSYEKFATDVSLHEICHQYFIPKYLG